MGSLIETFHIDVKLLIAQIINFAIVISVLYYFALKPLIKVMRDRTAKIEKSLEDAKRIDEKMDKTEAEYKEALASAKKEANEILTQARADADVKKEELVKKAKEEIGKLINEEKAKMQQEKARTLKEIRSEVADLVAAGLEKVLEKKIDGKTDKELIKKLIK